VFAQIDWTGIATLVTALVGAVQAWRGMQTSKSNGRKADTIQTTVNGRTERIERELKFANERIAGLETIVRTLRDRDRASRRSDISAAPAVGDHR